MSQVLCRDLLAKIGEQMERTEHLIGLSSPHYPGERVTAAWSVADLLGHLLECLAGFCAVLYAANPDRLAHFAAMRELPVNQPRNQEEVRERIAIYRRHIDEGFALLSDSDLSRKIPTVFVADGETILTLLLGNLEHLINHKHQLFGALQRLGVTLGTPDLYCLRGA